MFILHSTIYTTKVCHTDTDECAEGLDNCSTNATCTDTLGSYTCVCNLGFTGDGRNCSGEYTAVRSSREPELGLLCRRDC